MGSTLETLQQIASGWLPEIAAAGGPSKPTGIVIHPDTRGARATAVARRITRMMPSQGPAMAADRVRIYAMAGLFDVHDHNPFASVREPPFRAPHHTCSQRGMSGSIGGLWPHPGEVHLAHGGVLLLDEAEEFQTAALDAVSIAWLDGKCALSHAAPVLKLLSVFFLVCVVYDLDRWKALCHKSRFIADIDARTCYFSLSQGEMDTVIAAYP